MPDRSTLKGLFLAHAGWETAAAEPIAGDASLRHYTRLVRPDGTSAILMDAPPEAGEDVRPFISVAGHLRAQGLSVPEILSRDPENGFLLLEDLGDDLFARRLGSSPEMELSLYEAAVDVLLALHQRPAPATLPDYGFDDMIDRACLAYTYFAEGGGKAVARERDFQNLLGQALTNIVGPGCVTVHRDYHAENLLWLPTRSGIARVGLLDFQDACKGHAAYDLVSLLEDARRDVPPEIQSRMLERYLNGSGADRDSFIAAYHVLGAQRNLRIIGVFARLAKLHGKPKYIGFIPRVWRYLLQDLDHPNLAELRDCVLSRLPEPTDAVLDGLRSA